LFVSDGSASPNGSVPAVRGGEFTGLRWRFEPASGGEFAGPRTLVKIQAGKLSLQPEALGADQEATNGLKHSEKRP
jgi:hypothetical protein